VSLPVADAAGQAVVVGPSLSDPDLYLDREISLLAFQRRVLEEAREVSNPLLERVKFLSILFSNLDEFLMVRVAILRQRVDSTERDPAAVDHLQRVIEQVRQLAADAYAVWPEIKSALAAAGIRIQDYAELNPSERDAADAYFRRAVYPILTPLAVDTAHPFPHISNLSLNLAVMVQDAKGVRRFAEVKVPNTLPQLVSVPHAPAGSTPSLVWLEQIIEANLKDLFPDLEVVEGRPFRVTRDAEYEVQEVGGEDLLETIEDAVWERRFRDIVQLQVAHDVPQDVLDLLLSNLEVEPDEVQRVHGPLDLSRIRQLLALDRPKLKDPPLVPHTPAALHLRPGDDLFAVLRREDLLLHHPFESFDPVLDFLQRAVRDPAVLAIKMTLYRVGRNSPVVECLLRAIEKGKQVAVLVELKARFDEESNIEWARALEAAGAHVVYGVIGLKVHSKVAMVVRQEGDAIRRYVHLGTGNYNPSTAKLYTDLSFFTSSEQIGADVTEVFNLVTGYAGTRNFRKLLVAPAHLRSKFEALIQREIDFASSGVPGHLIFKMNSLEDPTMVQLLYRASQAGVKIELLVRGFCCLRPGVEGISANVSVTSIVGRFLEHSRIYYFRNGGNEEVYAGSADLMVRNLDRRVEILFPVEAQKLSTRLRDEILRTYLADTRNAWRMCPDGTYQRVEAGAASLNSHAHFLNLPAN
jgi:polyphosphate kinase